MLKIMRGILNKKCRIAVLLLLALSAGSYIALHVYSASTYHQNVRNVHAKEYFAANYNSSVTKSKRKGTEPFNVEHIPVFSKLRNYMMDIESVRSKLLSKTKSEARPVVSPVYTVIDGYDENFFAKLKVNPHVETIFLTANESAAASIMPVKKNFDYGSTKFGCYRMVQYKWAMYHTGFELYNKTCRSNLSDTLVPLTSIDRKSLSIGLPFQLSSKNASPTGHPASELILTFIHIVEHGLISSHGDVFTHDTCIKTQTCNKNIVFPTNITNVPLYDEVLTITEQGSIWYYHMTIEDLPRISPYMEFLQKHPQIKIHVSLAGYHLDMLAELGFGTDRIVWGDVGARIVYLPAGTACGRPTALTTPLLSLLMRKKVEERIGQQKQDTIVILHRTDSFRQFKEHDAIHKAVYELANQYDLKVQVFSDSHLPSLRVGMEYFYRAKAIIGPHGSGMANMIFTQPGTLVIEGLCYMESWYGFCWKGIIPWVCPKPTTRFSLTFRNIAAVLGLHYYGIVRGDDCLYTTASEVIEPLRFYLSHK